MSKQYPGGFITKTPVTPTPSSAPGIWTLEQQLQAQQAGTWPFGGPFNYIEDVFSTYLYTGNGATQTITNGIDLAGNGGLVWIKDRNTSYGHYLFDTIRGGNKSISSNSTSGQNTQTNNSVNFLSSGFSVDNVNVFSQNVNLGGGNTYVSWTFREQSKFFDVVTYTGTGSARTIAHNLGSVPGCIIVKRTDTTSDWQVYHSSLANTQYLVLNDTAAVDTGATRWNSTTPTSSVFSLGTDASVNASGGTYVAYLFASNANGFGLTGTDNVITCGSYTGNGSSTGPVVTLGYEPQWIIIKNATSATGWEIYDNMRGVATGGNDAKLLANSSATEETTSNILSFNATGFQLTNAFSNTNGSGQTYIYIAIRRGPMKVPTVGTSVYNAIVRNGTGAVANVTGVGFSPDLITVKNRNAGYDNNWVDKLRGALPILAASNTNAEVTDTTTAVTAFGQDGVTLGDNNIGTYGGAVNYFLANSYVNWFFKRAPGFFDEVCYTGTGNVGADATRITHNLGVAPELIIVKGRTNAVGWPVYSQTTGVNSYLLVNTTDATASLTGIWATTAPTTTTFGVSNGGGSFNNGGGVTYVAYLFATCPGVSKVGSYSGTGATQTINCGFTGGARFVLIKRTDSTGDWYVWDTARGMVAGTDPSLLLNTTAAEVNANSVYTTGVGFQIVSTAAGINASGGSYIFLAVA